MQEIVPKDEAEVPKYQKKKASSISQSRSKSKHTHMRGLQVIPIEN